MILRLTKSRAFQPIRRAIDKRMRRRPLVVSNRSSTVIAHSMSEWHAAYRCLENGVGYSPEWIAERWNNRKRGGAVRIADIGCHIGLFTLWMAKKNTLAGIAVDANGEMVKRCRQNLLASDVDGVDVIAGKIGGGRLFWVDPDATISSEFHQEGRTAIDTGPIDLLTSWRIHFKENPSWGDFLKVDIEGSEFDLVNETPFVSMFDSLIIEWHEPACNLCHLRYMLQASHRLAKFDKSPTGGVGYFEKI